MTWTVLIVDDEPHVRHMVSFKLRDAGFNVLVADSGEEAWNLARRRYPDLIVSDLQMRRVDGLELCRKLADEPRTATIPVILLTARGHRITDKELADVNIRHIMPKPFSARELVELVLEILNAEADRHGEDTGADAA